MTETRTKSKFVLEKAGYLKRAIIFLFALVVFNLGLIEINAWAELSVSLTIDNPSDLERTLEPTTSGVPLPKSANAYSVDQIQLKDENGNEVPAQFKVLSRWNGLPSDSTKPIKWILLDFQPTVPANGQRTYMLEEKADGSSLSSNLKAVEDSQKIEITTGKAKFHINKDGFNLFDYVWIDSDNDSEMDLEVLSSSGKGGIILTDKNGKKFSSIHEAPEEIEIEEQGLMKVVVLIRGVMKAQDGEYFAPSICGSAEYSKFCQPYPNSFFYYNCRIFFYNDKDYVKLQLSLENNGSNGRTNPEQNYAPSQPVYFEDLNLEIYPKLSSQSLLAFTGNLEIELGQDDLFEIYQDWKENLTDSDDRTLEPVFEQGIYYSVKKNENELASGKTHSGSFGLVDQSFGVDVAVKNFWQNFPKKLQIGSQKISIGLWPGEGYYPYCNSSDFSEEEYDMYCQEGGRQSQAYLFDAGRHKTYEMLLRFRLPGSSNETYSKSSVNFLETPLMALAPSEWYASTEALGMIAPGGVTSDEEEMAEALSRFDLLQRSMVDEEISENGWSLNSIKTEYPLHWETKNQSLFFGWMNFGDLLWSGGHPSSLHYDWPYTMLLNYLRTGDRKLFDTGCDMAIHRYDIDQYHGERTSTEGHHKWINHMQFYESSGHSDPSVKSYLPARVGLGSHTWNGGILLYYCLTGDRKALEAAEEVGQAALNHFGADGLKSAQNSGCSDDETRLETWPMLNLVHLYRVTGEDEYLTVARNIAVNRLIPREQQAGKIGHFGKGPAGSIDPTIQSGTFYTYSIEPILALAQEIESSELDALILRMANFSKTKLLFGNVTDESGNYMPIQHTYYWHEEDPYGEIEGDRGEPIKATFYADLFAYAYRLNHEPEYLEFAKRCFMDTVFYHGVIGSQFVDSNYRTKMSYVEGFFASSHTKIHGWLGRTNQVFLNTLWSYDVDSGPLNIITYTLPSAEFYKEFNYKIGISGGAPPYVFSLTANSCGNLAIGSDGTISGIPISLETCGLSVSVTDSTSGQDVQSYDLEVVDLAPEKPYGVSGGLK